jgi:hypothetical protein
VLDEPRRSARSRHSCCAACDAARSPPAEVVADTRIGEAGLVALAHPKRGHDVSGCRDARGT